MEQSIAIPQILSRLQENGITLYLEANKLKVKAPKGAMTSEFQQLIRNNKEMLVALIEQAAEARENGAEAESSETKQLPYHNLMAALGGQFVPLGGVETPWYYAGNAGLIERFSDRLPDRTEAANGIGQGNRQDRSPITGCEHLAVRESVGLADWSWAIGLIEITGPGSLDFLNLIASNQMNMPVGGVKYTLFLSEQGTIKRDVTIHRVEKDRFWILNGKANMQADLAWMERYRPLDDSVMITDLSEEYITLGLWGPNARKVLQQVTELDLSNESLPYFTGKDAIVGIAPAKILRLSYAGEMGYEIYVPASFGARLWNLLYVAGQMYDLVPVGAAAIFSLRIEKGYLLIGSDIGLKTKPHEAGLNWLISKKKETFVGREAVLADRKEAPKTKLAVLTFADPAVNLYGYEQLFVGDMPVGHIASGAYGYSVGAFIALAWIDATHAEMGNEIEVEIGSSRFTGIVSPTCLFDPTNERMKG